MRAASVRSWLVATRAMISSAVSAVGAAVCAAIAQPEDKAIPMASGTRRRMPFPTLATCPRFRLFDRNANEAVLRQFPFQQMHYAVLDEALQSALFGTLRGLLRRS